MVPTGKTSPDWCELTNVAIPELSVAVGAVQVTTAPHAPASLLWVRLLGVPVITGFSVSLIVTVKLLVRTLPWISVAV